MRCALTLALAAMSFACAGAQAGTSAEMCGDFELDVDHYWSASIRAQVLEHSGELELERRKGVVNKMDRISEDWVMMRTATCRDHFVRELISEREYVERVRCFDDRLDRQRTLATALAGDAALDEIEAALGELLAEPVSCANSNTEGQTL